MRAKDNEIKWNYKVGSPFFSRKIDGNWGGGGQCVIIKRDGSRDFFVTSYVPGALHLTVKKIWAFEIISGVIGLTNQDIFFKYNLTVINLLQTNLNVKNEIKRSKYHLLHNFYLCCVDFMHHNFFSHTVIKNVTF